MFTWVCISLFFFLKIKQAKIVHIFLITVGIVGVWLKGCFTSKVKNAAEMEPFEVL